MPNDPGNMVPNLWDTPAERSLKYQNRVAYFAAKREAKLGHQHTYTAARVGHNVHWWQCTECGHLTPMTDAERAER